MTKQISLALFLGSLWLLPSSCTDTEATKEAFENRVTMQQTDSGAWKLRLNGEPLVIKGAGGQSHLALMKASGANTLRTWGAETLDETVDGKNLVERAKQHGLMITAGVWVEHERHGFDYGDPEQIQKQRDHVRNFVTKWKDEDTINIWGLGNEMEWHGNDPRIWNELEELAQIVRKEDPSRLIMTVIAGAPANKIQSLMTLAPTIDILGINAYAGGPTAIQAAAEAGWNKPVMLTEFGPLGHWEVEKTPWGAPVEQSDQEKRDHYLSTHERVMNDPSGLCVGTFPFFWGQKQERTPTWYGMFLSSGEKLPAVDVMTKAWTGDWPENQCPNISRFSSAAAKSAVNAKEAIEVTLEVSDPENDSLTLSWSFAQESTDLKEGGDREAAPPEVPVTMTKLSPGTWQCEAPEEPGNYRLFLIVRDGKGNAGVGNFPFQVQE